MSRFGTKLGNFLDENIDALAKLVGERLRVARGGCVSHQQESSST